MNNYKSSESVSALLATPRTTPNLSSTSALRDWSTLWLACALIGPKFAGWEGPGRRSLFSRLRPKFGTVSRRRRQCAHGGYDTVTVRRLTSTDERRRRRVHFALWLAVPRSRCRFSLERLARALSFRNTTACALERSRARPDFISVFF